MQVIFGLAKDGSEYIGLSLKKKHVLIFSPVQVTQQRKYDQQ